ncbi:MAG TPA: four-carbon acid sugar kinase family protein [Roseiflexaceae bacterium]|jgi:uncharacterized protein YgbK (DUF1537 family)
MNNSLPQHILRAELFAGLPPEWPDDPFPAIQAAVRASGVKVVVLDDDPTGTQTVHGVPVLTEWPVESLRSELANDLPACYLLTNSRSLMLGEARALNAAIGRNLVKAARGAGRAFVVVSRSDSTLRGHFPGEVEALASALGQDFDAWLLVPFFQAGGRYTIDDIHYVADGDRLVPAGKTEFARDAVFGYRASNLREWVAEKTGGRVPAANVASIRLDDIRRGGPDRVAERLGSLARGGICVVNAASARDLDVFTRGLLAAEARGKRYLYRTASSFAAVRAGIAPRPLLMRPELQLPEGSGGLVVVGSYVPKTSGQVDALLARPGVVGVEVGVEALLDARQRSEIERAARAADDVLSRGEDVVLYTSRRLITGDGAERSLAIGQRVSASLVAIVRAITRRPRYLLAKGGITSSDVATRGLDVRRALVIGQILPGVAVWELGPESRHPGLAYIVFPGNVGGPGALAEIVEMLKVGD